MTENTRTDNAFDINAKTLHKKCVFLFFYSLFLSPEVTAENIFQLSHIAATKMQCLQRQK